MSKWVHQDVLLNGINEIKNANRIAAVIAFTPGDSYATVSNAANIVAESTGIVAGDYTVTSVPNGQASITSPSGLSDSAANNNGDPTHWAFFDDTGSRVLWVTTESSVQNVTAGNPATIPQLTYASNQPT